MLLVDVYRQCVAGNMAEVNQLVGNNVNNASVSYYCIVNFLTSVDSNVYFL